MTDQDVRNAVATSVAETHGNPEFIRQLREGEQDDGPYMQGAFAMMNHINEHFMLTPVLDCVDDE